MRGIHKWPVILIATAALAVGTGCGDDDDDDMGDADAGRDADSGRDGDSGDNDGDIPDGGEADGDATLVDGDAGPTTSTEAPDEFSVVADEDDGFTSPTDAVSTSDGATFYFAAYDTNGEAGIFSVASTGGTVTPILTGAPFVYISGLEISPDNGTLYIADGAAGESGEGAIYSMPLAGSSAGVPEEIVLTVDEDEEIRFPNALAINADGSDLYVSAKDEMDRPTIYRLAPTGGEPQVFARESLVSPSGIYFDDETDTLHVADHLASGSGRGALFTVEAGLNPERTLDNLILGTPAGISLVSGGGTAVVTGRDTLGAAGLYIVVLGDTPEVTFTAFPTALNAVDPAGLRTARAAGVFVIVDSEGNKIYRGE